MRKFRLPICLCFAAFAAAAVSADQRSPGAAVTSSRASLPAAGAASVTGTTAQVASASSPLRSAVIRGRSIAGTNFSGDTGFLTTAAPFRLPAGRPRVYAFGSNAYGSLCLGSASPGALSAPTPMPLSDRFAIAQASIGTTHSLVLTDAGDVYACGLQQSGECGLGYRSGSLVSPTKIPSASWDGSPVVRVVAGNRRSAVITAAGTVYSFGYDSGGSLGLGTVPTCPTCGGCPCASTPMPIVDGLENVVIVDAALAESYSLLLSDTGGVYLVGSAPSGDTFSRPTLVFSGATAVAATTTCAFVISNAAQVYGLGVKPSCGLGGVPSEVADDFELLTGFQRIDENDREFISSIAAGPYHAILVTIHGVAYGVGDNTFGQLGISVDDLDGAPVPNKIPIASYVVAAGAGVGTSYLVTVNGGLLSAGSNAQGALGRSPPNGAASDWNFAAPGGVPDSSFIVGASAGYGVLLQTVDTTSVPDQLSSAPPPPGGRSPPTGLWGTEGDSLKWTLIGCGVGLFVFLTVLIIICLFAKRGNPKIKFKRLHDRAQTMVPPPPGYGYYDEARGRRASLRHLGDEPLDDTASMIELDDDLAERQHEKLARERQLQQFARSASASGRRLNFSADDASTFDPDDPDRPWDRGADSAALYALPAPPGSSASVARRGWRRNALMQHERSSSPESGGSDRERDPWDDPDASAMVVGGKFGSSRNSPTIVRRGVRRPGSAGSDTSERAESPNNGDEPPEPWARHDDLEPDSLNLQPRRSPKSPLTRSFRPWSAGAADDGRGDALPPGFDDDSDAYRPDAEPESLNLQARRAAKGPVSRSAKFWNSAADDASAPPSFGDGDAQHSSLDEETLGGRGTRPTASAAVGRRLNFTAGATAAAGDGGGEQLPATLSNSDQEFLSGSNDADDAAWRLSSQQQRRVVPPGSRPGQPPDEAHGVGAVIDFETATTLAVKRNSERLAKVYEQLRKRPFKPGKLLTQRDAARVVQRAWRKHLFRARLGFGRMSRDSTILALHAIRPVVPLSSGSSMPVNSGASDLAALDDLFASRPRPSEALLDRLAGGGLSAPAAAPFTEALQTMNDPAPPPPPDFVALELTDAPPIAAPRERSPNASPHGFAWGEEAAARGLVASASASLAQQAVATRRRPKPSPMMMESGSSDSLFGLSDSGGSAGAEAPSFPLSAGGVWRPSPTASPTGSPLTPRSPPASTSMELPISSSSAFSPPPTALTKGQHPPQRQQDSPPPPPGMERSLSDSATHVGGAMFSPRVGPGFAPVTPLNLPPSNERPPADAEPTARGSTPKGRQEPASLSGPAPNMFSPRKDKDVFAPVGPEPASLAVETLVVAQDDRLNLVPPSPSALRKLQLSPSPFGSSSNEQAPWSPKGSPKSSPKPVLPAARNVVSPVAAAASAAAAAADEEQPAESPAEPAAVQASETPTKSGARASKKPQLTVSAGLGDMGKKKSKAKPKPGKKAVTVLAPPASGRRRDDEYETDDLFVFQHVKLRRPFTPDTAASAIQRWYRRLAEASHATRDQVALSAASKQKIRMLFGAHSGGAGATG